jgi:hypothetical protein
MPRQAVSRMGPEVGVVGGVVVARTHDAVRVTPSYRSNVRDPARRLWRRYRFSLCSSAGSDLGS